MVIILGSIILQIIKNFYWAMFFLAPIFYVVYRLWDLVFRDGNCPLDIWAGVAFLDGPCGGLLGVSACSGCLSVFWAVPVLSRDHIILLGSCYSMIL